MTYDLAPLLDKLEVEYDPDRGGNQKILCPVHEERDPSCSLNLNEGLLQCFACGFAGDAITLVMTLEGLEFGASKRFVESLAGENRRAVPRDADAGGSFLPRKQGSRPGRRVWRSPWTRS